MYRAWHYFSGEKPRPQFFLRDDQGREYGVVEWYSDAPEEPPAHVALEFVSADFSAARPWVLVNLESWKTVAGREKNLPDEFFKDGLEAYLSRWDEKEKQLRLDRVRRAAFHAPIQMAEKGYTVGYHELFPKDMPQEGLPRIRVADQWVRLIDQYGIRPGEFRHEVTLVLMPETVLKSQGEPAPLALVNWRFGEGFDVLDSKIPEEDVADAVQGFMENHERESHFQRRLTQMRREGVLLGVKPLLAVNE